MNREIDSADILKRDSGHSSNERQGRDLNWNSCSKQMRPRVVGSTLYVSERDLASEASALSRARDPADILARLALVCQSHVRCQRRGKRQDSAKTFVRLPRHLHARNNFLADVAPFFVIDRARFQVRFDGYDFICQLAAPARNAPFDAKSFRANIIAKRKPL